MLLLRIYFSDMEFPKTRLHFLPFLSYIRKAENVDAAVKFIGEKQNFHSLPFSKEKKKRRKRE